MNDIKFKITENLSVSDGNNECVSVEIENKNSKSLLITCSYRPPSGANKEFINYLENVFKSTNAENKLYFVVTDFNLNCFYLRMVAFLW